MNTQPAPGPRRRRREPEPIHRTPDVVGITLIATGCLVLLSLFMSNTGVLGSALGNVFKLLCGRGAWAVPVMFGFMGVSLIRGQRAAPFSHLTLGVCLMFVSILGFLSASNTNSDFFDPSRIEVSGGYLGAIIGWGSHALLGEARFVILVAIALVGLVFCLNSTLKQTLIALNQFRAARHEDVQERRIQERRARPVKEAVVEFRGAEFEDEEGEPVESKRKPTPTFGLQRPKASETPTLAIQQSSKEGYQLPGMSHLAEVAPKPKRTTQEMQANIETLESTLEEFGIDANVTEVAAGPTVTRYEIQLGPGIRVARITALADNIAMNLAASHVRVEAPIPGKAAIGVEVPNAKPSMVALREVCDTPDFTDNPSRLWVALGQDVSGVNKYADLTRMPHLLIGGATNSGKSIGLATIITSLLLRNTPKDLRMVMIDPKRVELSLFDNIPHLMCPVIKDVKEAPGVLRAVWREMDRRYDMFSERQVRNIDGWNSKATFQEKLPYIVVIIDELADLMIQAAAEVETSICRLAQLARATGIHLVIATQRPSVDVITGTIKANISSRIAFTVSSQIDSRTILDQKGAESLIGRGDMLFLPIDASKPLRVQGCYVSEKEIENVCEFWRAQEAPQYVLSPEEYVHDEKKESGDFGDQAVDPLWQDAVTFVAERGEASTSMLQRRFKLGFQRASRMLDQMEERGIVGPRDGPRPREVLVSVSEAAALFGGEVQYDTGWIGDD